MPANPTAADATYFTPSLGPANRGVLKNILNITTPQPSTDVVSFNDVMNVVQQELPVIFQGNETVTAGLTKAPRTGNSPDAGRERTSYRGTTTRR